MLEKSYDEYCQTTSHRHGLEDIVWTKEKYDRAPTEQKSLLLKEWGEKIAFHLVCEKQSPNYSLHASSCLSAEQIGDAIITFFEAARVALVARPWPHTPEGKPNNAALAGIVSILDAISPNKNIGSVSPTMDYILNARAWNPDGLWFALDSTQNLAKDQLALTDKSWQAQPFWRWTAQLGIQACITDWTPNKNFQGDKMWYVTPFQQLPDPDAAVRTLAAKVPGSFGAALEYYQDEPEEHVSADMAKTIFQMDYAQANAGLSTKLLLSLMFDYSRYHAYGAGMQIFQDKHPDLFAVFELQVSMHDSSDDAEKYASSCETAWMQAVHGKPIDCIPLPDLGLERP